VSELLEYEPTAMHALAVVHDTPDSPERSSVGFGVVWVAQLVPFHRSAHVNWVDAVLS
jgi:hypothetical protein